MKEPDINPWEHTTAWKTQSAFYSWVRGQMRRFWKDNPVRIDFKKSKLRPVTKAERRDKVFHPSTKNVGQCYLCGDWFAGSRLEVDHLEPAGSCRDFESSIEFYKAQVFCPPTNMALTCIPCHRTKTLQDKRGFATFEEAQREQRAIAFVKQPVEQQMAFFKQRDMDVPPSKEKRRKAFIDVLREEAE